ncbi:MAG: hypothetical protein DMF85_16260, partial [Acidobacteria bacterium]
IADGLFGEAPAGDRHLIIGHENVGVIEDVGRRVRGWRRGQIVVATVRRPCGRCFNCGRGENDMCTSGLFSERGIRRRHGYMAQYYAESPAFLHRIPKALANVAVLLEPLSIVEKGIDHSFRLQRRFLWKPRTAVVLGAGPIGLLAAAVLRIRGRSTCPPRIGRWRIFRRRSIRSILPSKRRGCRPSRSARCRFSVRTACCAC